MCFGAHSHILFILEHEISMIASAIEKLQEKICKLYPSYIDERIKQLAILLRTRTGLWEEYDNRIELETLLNK